MAKELVYLVLTALLNAVLWVPVVIGYVRARGLLTPSDYVKAPDSPLPDWVNRANRAHQNAVENFSPFAAIVIVGALTRSFTTTTEILAATYFFARLVHAIVHISGFNKLMARTVIFSIGNLATLALGVLVLRRLLSA